MHLRVKVPFLAFLVSVSSLFLDLQAALQKQQEVAVAGASSPTSSKVNATTPSDMMSVNGQAKAHLDNTEKETEPEAAEEALENGPKGVVVVCALPSRYCNSDSWKAKVRKSDSLAFESSYIFVRVEWFFTLFSLTLMLLVTLRIV